MKSIVNKTMKFLSGLRFNYQKEEDASALGKVDFGVLTVAMMVAALDGEISPDELSAFERLAKKCRVSEGEHKAYYDSALHSAGYILLKQKTCGEKLLVEAFLAEAERVLPRGFTGGKVEDVRRALVIWTAMGMSDGNFSGIERLCVEKFRAKAVEAMKRRRDCNEELWRGLSPAFQTAYSRGPRFDRPESSSVPGVDFSERIEKLIAAGDYVALRRLIVNG